MSERKIARIVFERVDEPEADENGRWWYLINGEPYSWSRRQPPGFRPLRRTVEYEGPVVWYGYKHPDHIAGAGWRRRMQG